MMGGCAMGGYMMVFFWAFIIIVVIALVKWIGPTSGRSRQRRDDSNSGDNSAALDILKQRYARGEIDEQELQEKKRALL
jgi:putative membrane protein